MSVTEDTKSVVIPNGPAVIEMWGGGGGGRVAGLTYDQTIVHGSFGVDTSVQEMYDKNTTNDRKSIAAWGGGGGGGYLKAKVNISGPLNIVIGQGGGVGANGTNTIVTGTGIDLEIGGGKTQSNIFSQAEGGAIVSTIGTVSNHVITGSYGTLSAVKYQQDISSPDGNDLLTVEVNTYNGQGGSSFKSSGGIPISSPYLKYYQRDGSNTGTWTNYFDSTLQQDFSTANGTFPGGGGASSPGDLTLGEITGTGANGLVLITY